MEAADGEAAKAFGLGGEGAESGVDVGVRKRKHVGIGSGWWWWCWEWWVRIVFMGGRNSVVRDGVTVFPMKVYMSVTHFVVGVRFQVRASVLFDK